MDLGLILHPYSSCKFHKIQTYATFGIPLFDPQNRFHFYCDVSCSWRQLQDENIYQMQNNDFLTRNLSTIYQGKQDHPNNIYKIQNMIMYCRWQLHALLINCPPLSIVALIMMADQTFCIVKIVKPINDLSSHSKICQTIQRFVKPFKDLSNL